MSVRKSGKKSAAFYKAAVRGVIDREGELSPSLRRVAVGFKASEGYDLRKVNQWTPSQKRRVTNYFHELQNLTAQQKIILRPRNAERLKEAQIIGGHSKGFKFKVAFVPGSAKAKAVWTKEGLSIVEPTHEKMEREFNKIALARDPEKEIDRVIESTRKIVGYRDDGTPIRRTATDFHIKAGENLVMKTYDATILKQQVLNLMNRYDGVKPLPRGSGNYGDAPKSHNWRRWLNGVVGYHFLKHKTENKIREFRTIEDANRAVQKRRARMRARLKREKGGK